MTLITLEDSQACDHISGGTAPEQFASRRAAAVLDALAKRMPQVAHRKRGSDLSDVRLGDIAVGDTLVVFPHEICPVDGVVVEGHGKMNEAYLTGEPFEIAKTPGSEVLSGSINCDSALNIRAEKLAVDSRYARIMQVIQDAEQRPRIRRLGDKLGAWYTPLALSLAGIAWAATGESHRFLAVLVVATPCPLLISIPVAVIGAISLSARRGIIIKNPAALEQIDRCRTLIFDKTGTLTYGKPSLSEILCAPGFAEDEVLRIAASLDHYSKHPLSQAILEAAQTANLPVELVSEISERPGEGLRGKVGQLSVSITNRKKVFERQLAFPPVNVWITPKWGEHRLSDVRTVEVESWLHALSLANATKAKVRNVMHVIFAHACRHELLQKNPISLVRQSAKRKRTPDVLDAGELKKLLTELQNPARALVFLTAATGLRVSEALGLKWSDVEFGAGIINLGPAVVHHTLAK